MGKAKDRVQCYSYTFFDLSLHSVLGLSIAKDSRFQMDNFRHNPILFYFKHIVHDTLVVERFSILYQEGLSARF